MNITDRTTASDEEFRARITRLDATEGALLRLDAASEWIRILKEEDGENGSLIDVTLPACIAVIRDVMALADELQRFDPWMVGDDYGEGYTDGKSVAARRIRAAIAALDPS